MRRYAAVALIVGSAVMALVVSRTDTAARQRPPALFAMCLHDEHAIQGNRARREGALDLARAINAAQGRAAEATRRYQPLSALPDLPPAPAGFEVRLYTDGDGYIFSIKDGRDPCHYGIFSDQHGRIYESSPQVPQIAS
jgi:hypothetical protein